MYTFSPMMVANSRKHHCRVRPYTREVLVISTNLDIQKNHYPLDFTNRKGIEARIKNTWYNQGLVNEWLTKTLHEIYDMGCHQVDDDYLDGFILPFAMYDMGSKKVDHKFGIWGVVIMDPEVKDKDAEIQVFGINVYPLPFIPPKVERKEMSKEAKKEFYAMPKDAQDWYRQYKPALGEPEVAPDPNDEQLWFSKTPFEVVPNGKPWKLPYGTLDFEVKSHLDYHDPYSRVSKEEYEAWEDHLESLPPEKQRLIKSFMNPPPIHIGQPSKGEENTADDQEY
ncbi:hypothetical protein Tco_1377270 [Tanacetum coccineum]